MQFYDPTRWRDDFSRAIVVPSRISRQQFFIARSAPLCGNIIRSRESPMPRTKSSNSFDKHVGSRIRMRRKMLDDESDNAWRRLGNYISASSQIRDRQEPIGTSRLHHISQILQVPPTFFFEDDMPAGDSKHMIASPNTVMDFMSTSEGLALAKAFMKIRSMPMRRRIVELVEEIGDGRPH